MKYRRFEETPVWKAAAELGERVLLLADRPACRRRGDLRDQLQRAALSVSNNIAEGFERGTTDSLIAFLYYAKGSAGEVRSMLRVCLRLPWFEDLRSEISDLISLSESISRQLQGWAESLQNAGVRGVRHLNDAVREERERKARASAFLERLERLRRGEEGGGAAS